MAQFDIKVTLTKAQVQEAIALYMRQSGMSVDSVAFNVADTSNDRWRGGPNYEFINATVKVTPTNTSMPFSSLASQIESIERNVMGDR